MAGRLALSWTLLSVACVLIIWQGSLAEHEVDGIVALHWAVTLVTGPVIGTLFGLDVAQLKFTGKDSASG